MLKLRALIAADAQHLADWGMDEDFRIAAGWTKRSHDQHLRFHERLIKSNDDEPTRLAIIDGDQLVGYVDFTPDDVGSCDLGIAIGPSARWGQHLGREAITLAAYRARHRYAASRVWARTHSPNTAARRMLAAVGFVEVGPCGTDDYRGNRSR